MDVAEAVSSRRSIRQFRDDPVDKEIMERVLRRAQRAPSGGNVQPWHALVLTGEPLRQLSEKVIAVFPEGRRAHSQEYAIYPPELADPYETRRGGVGADMFASLDIAREDKAARIEWVSNNYRAFGAPVLMLVHTPEYMGPPQWSDIGGWLQTVMLLLRGEGLDSCPQEAWAHYSREVRETVSIPDGHTFFCGLAIGYREPEAAVNNFPVKRAPLSEAIRWEGW